MCFIFSAAPLLYNNSAPDAR